MKKLLCIMMIAVLCISLSACALASVRSVRETEAPGATEAPVETQAPATEAPATEAPASGKRFETIDDYLADPAVKASIDTATSIEGLDMDVYADGDTLVYDYTYQTHFDDSVLPTVKTQLDASLEQETTASAFELVITELENNVNVENPKVKVIYRNDDGTEITSKVFQK